MPSPGRVCNAFGQSKWLPSWRKDMSKFEWWQFDILIRGCHCQLLELSLLFNKLSCLPFVEWNQLFACSRCLFSLHFFIFSFPQMVQYQISTKMRQSNQTAICFARKWISRIFHIFGPENCEQRRNCSLKHKLWPKGWLHTKAEKHNLTLITNG